MTCYLEAKVEEDGYIVLVALSKPIASHVGSLATAPLRRSAVHHRAWPCKDDEPGGLLLTSGRGIHT